MKLWTADNLSSLLQAFLVCCLIPLDKNPGLLPIGIGAILHRIADKVIASNIRKDQVSWVGLLQVYAGWSLLWIDHNAMHEFYEEENSSNFTRKCLQCIQLVSRKTFQHNIGIICPPIERCVRNCYNLPYRLFIAGGGEIQYTEGTTQGDSNTMAIYAIAIIPLIPTIVNLTR